ncbi:hypothetical protein [Fimbriimonas ginsengisoli]|uniref:Alpha-galactosidase n=1 Tax=Fimbriimonas ginsengisoli Gsoil 348 TaxID=661478 RepID=A0A068NNP0_FIMGI|nr:hypothetical protein [Fimbriimonas ginsengisoli]AIE85017.1 alpha-galactosidase [Fimbriimonas ginsengisoli Gsoil 348]
MIVVAALLGQIYAPLEPSLDRSKPESVVIRLGRPALLRGVSHGECKEHLEITPAESLYLGYPHGPKTAEFVPQGATRRTFNVDLTGPLDALITASADSFLCNDRSDAPLSVSFGSGGNRLDNGVYDRKGDWLLTAQGTGVTLTPEGTGRYRLRVGSGPVKLRLRPDYYRNHLGYFLWDNTQSLWKQPVAGWCSWMAHLQDVTAANVLDAARFFSKNLKGYGYSVIQIDDGYQRVRQFPQGNEKVKEPFAHYWTIPNEKFPNGLQPLAQEITRLGLTPGIWVGYYTPLGLKNRDGYVTDADGKPHKGPWVNYAMNPLIPAAREEAYTETVRELRAQGWRYFKIDTLRHVLYDNFRQVPGYWKSRRESMETAYRTLLAETKRAAGPGSYLLACWGTLPELAGIPDGARIGEDVGPDVDSMRRSAKYIAQFGYLNNVVWRNDPDYMCLRVPVPQAQSWATLTALAGGHVMVSDPIKEYDPARVDVLRRVGPPLIVKPASVVSHGPDPEFMTLNGAKGDERWLVAARFGWGDQPARRVDLATLGLDPSRRYLAFDFWKERFLGIVSGEAAYDPLENGGCQVISFRPLADHPQVLGTNRHIGQGAYELDRVHWDGQALSGRMRRGLGRVWSLYLYVPAGWRTALVDGAAASNPSPQVLKLTFPSGASTADWKVTFIK